jgi:chromate reductase
MKVLGVAGSLRSGSHNQRLLRAAAALLPPEAEFEEFGGLKAIPPFDEDDEDDPGDAVEHWREAIAAADGLLFATPEYNGSIPGQLKNAIDWASRPFEDPVIRAKNAAVIGASHSMFGGVWAQAELRKVLSTAGARVLDRELPVSYAAEAFDAGGRLVDRELEHRLEELVGQLVEQCRLSLQLAAAR